MHPTEWRETLLACNTYAACPAFLANSQWRGNNPHILRFGPQNSSSPQDTFQCIVVGRVLHRGSDLATHGTSLPSDSVEMASAAKLQFLMTADTGIYEEDFALAHHNLSLLEDQVAVTPRKFNFSTSGLLRFSWGLWEPRVNLSFSNVSQQNTRDEITANYAVRPEYAPIWDHIKTTHHIRQMPLYDRLNDEDILPSMFAERLPLSLVEVVFTLKHYYIPATPNFPDHDLFKADISDVVFMDE